MIFAAIADWAENNEYPVDFMCTELEVSRSGYYAWRTRPVSHRDLTDIAEYVKSSETVAVSWFGVRWLAR